jgi:hypothetical protein
MSPPEVPTVVYVHGAGNKPRQQDLKRAWDRDLFRRDMGQQARMAHYADLLHATPGSIGPDACTQDEALAALVVAAGAADAAAGETLPDDDADLLAGLTPRGHQLALSLSMSMAAQAVSRPPTAEESLAAILPLPPSLRRLLLRQLLQRLIPDADAYFFTDRKEPIRQRLRQALDAVAGPVVVISHSLGTVIAYDVLSEQSFAARTVPLLVTLGSPLGYTEIQDVVTRPLRIPAPVQLWANFADPLDLVTLDTSLADEFEGAPRVIDARVDNPSPNNHAACGYLGASRVRSTVTAAVPTALSG